MGDFNSRTGKRENNDTVRKYGDDKQHQGKANYSNQIKQFEDLEQFLAAQMDKFIWMQKTRTKTLSQIM